VPDAPAATFLTRLDARLERLGRVRVALGLGLVAFLVYIASNPHHDNHYAHYVWLADAWLHGRFDIAWPVSAGPVRNDYYIDVLPVAGQPGLGQIPYPPLPAVVLLPFVAVFGVGFDAELLAAAIGALNAALAWLLARRLASRPSTALLVAIFFSFGTVAWIAAARGTTWYLAHDVAMACTFGAILATLATGRHGSAEAPADDAPRRRLAGAFAAGVLLGLATLARLTALFGAPFLLLARDAGSERRPRDAGSRLRSAAPTVLGLALPVAALIAYDIASSGQPIQPSYVELYRTEVPAIESLYHADWFIEDPRYIPQNLTISLFEPPMLTRQCDVLATTPTCPEADKRLTLAPDPIGMSLLLTSPGWLIGLAALRLPLSRLAVAAGVAVAAIAVVDLMHFSQGWVQFGYRFSNDWAPFGLMLVALGLERYGVRRWTVALIAISTVVVLWGATWAELFGW
jgi:hypothetical protein